MDPAGKQAHDEQLGIPGVLHPELVQRHPRLHAGHGRQLQSVRFVLGITHTLMLLSTLLFLGAIDVPTLTKPVLFSKLIQDMERHGLLKPSSPVIAPLASKKSSKESGLSAEHHAEVSTSEMLTHYLNYLILRSRNSSPKRLRTLSLLLLFPLPLIPPLIQSLLMTLLHHLPTLTPKLSRSLPLHKTMRHSSFLASNMPRLRRTIRSLN